MSEATFRAKAPGIMRRLIADLAPLTPEDAAAILGNIGHETDGFRLMQEAHPRSGRGGWGWVQWTGSRRVAFEQYAAANKLTTDSDEANYGYLVIELKSSQKAALVATRAASSLADKTTAFEQKFERAGVPALDKRIRWAEIALDAFRKGAAPVTPVAPKAPVAPSVSVPESPKPAAPKHSIWGMLFGLFFGGNKAPAKAAEAPKTPTPPKAPTPLAVAPKLASASGVPAWFTAAEKRVGFHERGDNQGLDEFIALAHCGHNGDPWCAIFVNAMLESVGIKGSRSAMARSFEHSPDFVKLDGPALGAITTMWRGSSTSGSGHVFFYAGENGQGILALGGNQSDKVCRQFESRNRIVGYYWPKGVALPKTGKVAVVANADKVTKET